MVTGNIDRTGGQDVSDYNCLCSRLIVIEADAVGQNISDLNAASRCSTVLIRYRLALRRVVRGIGIVGNTVGQFHRSGVVDGIDAGIQRTLVHRHLESDGHDLTCRNRHIVPTQSGDSACGGHRGQILAVRGTAGHIGSACRDQVGHICGHRLRILIDHLHAVGQHIAHSDHIAIFYGDGGVGGAGAADALGGNALQGQPSVVAQIHRVVGVGAVLCAVVVSHVIGGLSGIGCFHIAVLSRAVIVGLLDVVVMAAGNAVGLVVAGHHIPAGGILIDDIFIIDLRLRDLDLDQRLLLDSGVSAVAVSAVGISRPVEILTHIVVSTGIQGVGCDLIALGIGDVSILGVCVVGVVVSRIEGSLGHTSMVRGGACRAVPVVGEEVVGIAFHIGLSHAVGGSLCRIIGANLLCHVVGVDIILQTDLIDHPGGLCFLHLGSVGLVAAVVGAFGNQHPLNTQQACRGTDDHSLLIRCSQGTLDAYHEIQEIVHRRVQLSAGSAVEEVGAAHVGRCAGYNARTLNAFDIGDRVVLCVAQHLHLGILFALSSIAVAPPQDGVIVVGSVDKVKLIRRGDRLLQVAVDLLYTINPESEIASVRGYSYPAFITQPF